MIGKPVHTLKAIAPESTLSEPVIHQQHEEIDSEVISYLVNTWEWPSEKAKKGFVSWGLSDVVCFMFPTGELSRVKLACELLLLGFLIDDWFEHQSFAEAGAVISRLTSLLDNPAAFIPQTNMEHMHADLFARILAVRSASGAERSVLDAYMQMLACHGDATRGAPSTLRDYLVFREVDVGMPICMALLYWTEDISLSRDDAAALAPLEHLANYHVSILNDVFSFDKEWKAAQTLGEGGALVNGVRILADETLVSVEAAKKLCFSLVRAWEVDFRRMADQVVASAAVEDLASIERMVVGIERRMTGAEAFSWRSKRYM